MSEQALHVVIIGAGLGGACLAHGLKKAGISVAVYEREAARHDGLFGFRVVIAPDGSRALRDALPPDLYETFVATCAESPRHLTVYSEGLEELFTTGLPEADRQDARAVPGMRYASLMTLRQLLLTGIEDTVRFGKEFLRYERRPDGRITVFFADGTSTVGDVLVGADGSHSRVRHQRRPRDGVQDCGFVAAYGQVDLIEAARLLPWEMLRGISVVHSLQGPSLVTQPMEFRWDCEGELKTHVGGVDAALIKTWPGLRYDNTRDHLMWGLMSSSRLFPAEPEGLGGSRLIDVVADMTRRWSPALHTLVKLTDPATAVATRAVVSRPVDSQETTKVTLLGDAGHVRVPDPGTGANATLRAAGLLCRLLSRAVADRRPVVAAIRDYEAQALGSGFDFLAYWKCLNRQARLNKPFIGPVLAAGSRTRLRVANQTPKLKRRVAGEFNWLQGGGPAGSPRVW
ncbi:FAD-dependent monooxygenase [Streptosporangium carneum]|uniref:FAD-dependent oxidoreductase n=1 Tax=Streptosporangium carneum TaxID=47481 RepID=A0A9W6I2T8_9ACTN|nr:NAD(P)/FAD-dependent oxidoreductase [Streptosporangium carneum]GLK10995.1 FAD-dependent oxidoreductase [Streptosporangium carneum]